MPIGTHVSCVDNNLSVPDTSKSARSDSKNLGSWVDQLHTAHSFEANPTTKVVAAVYAITYSAVSHSHGNSSVSFVYASHSV